MHFGNSNQTNISRRRRQHGLYFRDSGGGDFNVGREFTRMLPAKAC